MSRVGRSPIDIPSGVNLEIQSGVVSVKGSKGALQMTIHPEMKVVQEENQLLVQRPSDAGEHRSLHGLTRALLANMVHGVHHGFTKVLELRGVGYRAEVKGKALDLVLGYSHPVLVDLPDAVSCDVVPSTPTMENGYLAATITLGCHDKQMLGDVAAEVRGKRPVEPYKGKGLRYRDEVVKRKLGKQAKSDKS